MQVERSTVHAVLSASSFGVQGLVALALIPILIAAYDVVGFGLVSLARLLLPVGILALLDFGLSEITTQVVARARGVKDWSDARGQLSLCVAIALATGILVGAALFALGYFGAALFGVPAELHGAFARMLIASALLMPWLYLSLVIEGFVKGSEQFRALRTVEIAAVLAFAALTLAAVYLRAPLEMVHYAFLGTMALRSLALLALYAARRAEAGFTRWTPANRHFVVQRAKLFLKGKFVGIAAGQLPAMLVAAMFGPASLALLEIVQKIPGFAKNLFSVTLGVLVPVAVRLDAQGKSDRFARIGRQCLCLASFFYVPPVVALMTFADRILGHWVGAEFVHLWPWLAAAAIWPMSAIVLQCTQTILLGRVSFLEASLRLTVRLTLLGLALGLVLSPVLREMAFVLGISLAGLALLPPFFRLFSRETGVPALEAVRLYGTMAATSLLSGALFWALALWAPRTWLVSALLGATYLAVTWALCYLQLADDDRTAVRRVARSALGIRTAAAA